MVDLIRREVLCDIIGNVGRQPFLLFPVEKMRRVGAVADVDRMNAARLLLADALVDPLGPRALDAHRDAGIFGLKGLSQPFGDVELERAVERDLAFLARGLDQRRRDLAGRRCRGLDGFGEQDAGQCRRCLEQVAPGPRLASHASSLAARAVARPLRSILQGV